MEKHKIDPNQSYMIGDNITDIQAGNIAGLKTILVLTGYGKKIEKEPNLKVDYIATSITDAANNYIT